MTNKSYHHKDLKNQLIRKGIELVATEGEQSFSLRKVATACGVSHAAPYSHFKNKEELLTAMQEHITDEFSELLENVIAEHRGKHEVLDYMGKAYVVFFVKNPHYASFLYTQSQIKIDLSFEADKEKNYKPFEIYKDLAIKILDEEKVPKEKQKDTIVAAWSMVHGIASLATMKNVHYDEDWEEKVLDLLNFFNYP